jgi:hypothetical protein
MQRVDVIIEVVGGSLKVSAVGFGRATVLGYVPMAPSDSDRRRFFARLHAGAAELGVNASALTQAIADIRERLAKRGAVVTTIDPQP